MRENTNCVWETKVKVIVKYELGKNKIHQSRIFLIRLCCIVHLYRVLVEIGIPTLQLLNTDLLH